MDYQQALKSLMTRRWRPQFKKATGKERRKRMPKTWKAYATNERKFPVFEAGVHSGSVFSNYKPEIEVCKYHRGGIGSVWELDLEAVDKLIMILLSAREELVWRLTEGHRGQSEVQKENHGRSRKRA